MSSGDIGAQKDRFFRLKFVGFIFFLAFFYVVFFNLFVFVGNTANLSSTSYITFFSFFLEPYLLFFLIIVCLQWLRWLLHLLQRRDVANLFVEKYFLPLFYGSSSYFFIVISTLILLSGFPLVETLDQETHASRLADVFLSLLIIFLPALLLLLPLLFLILISASSLLYVHDSGIKYVSLIAVTITAALDYYANLDGNYYDTILCFFDDTYFDTVFLSSILFFKGSELLVRPFLSNYYKPQHTAFSFPACVVILTFFYIILLMGMDFLCFSL